MRFIIIIIGIEQAACSLFSFKGVSYYEVVLEHPTYLIECRETTQAFGPVTRTGFWGFARESGIYKCIQLLLRRFPGM